MWGGFWRYSLNRWSDWLPFQWGSIMWRGLSARLCCITFWLLKLSNVIFFAGTSLSCAGIQRWKSVLFSCWAAINLVGEMSNGEEEDTPLGFLPHCEEFSILACSWFPSSLWRVLDPYLLFVSLLLEGKV